MNDNRKRVSPGKTVAGLLLGLMSTLLSPTVSAELISVQLDGARETLHLDLEKGVLYIGSDCSPFLYFSRAPGVRSKADRVKEFKVSQNKSRSANKTVTAPRLPSRIIIDGDDVEIVTHSVKGVSRAKGKSGSTQAIMSRASRSCKN